MGQHKHVFKLNDPRFFWKRGVEVIDVLMMFDDVCWDVFLFDDFLHVFEGTVFLGLRKSMNVTMMNTPKMSFVKPVVEILLQAN